MSSELRADVFRDGQGNGVAIRSVTELRDASGEQYFRCKFFLVVPQRTCQYIDHFDLGQFTFDDVGYLLQLLVIIMQVGGPQLEAVMAVVPTR